MQREEEEEREGKKESCKKFLVFKKRKMVPFICY